VEAVSNRAIILIEEPYYRNKITPEFLSLLKC
jgi:hypothetical protein